AVHARPAVGPRVEDVAVHGGAVGAAHGPATDPPRLHVDGLQARGLPFAGRVGGGMEQAASVDFDEEHVRDAVQGGGIGTGLVGIDGVLHHVQVGHHALGAQRPAGNGAALAQPAVRLAVDHHEGVVPGQVHQWQDRADVALTGAEAVRDLLAGPGLAIGADGAVPARPIVAGVG